MQLWKYACVHKHTHTLSFGGWKDTNSRSLYKRGDIQRISLKYKRPFPVDKGGENIQRTIWTKAQRQGEVVCLGNGKRVNSGDFLFGFSPKARIVDLDTTIK